MLTQNHHIIGYDIKDKKDLFIHAAIRYFGVWLIGIFLPALLFQTYGLPLYAIFGFFGLSSLVIVILHLTITGKIVSTYGSKIAMLIGIVFLIWFLISLYGLQRTIQYRLLWVSALFSGWFTTFFWTGYHYDMSEYAKTDHFGSKIANLNIIVTISSAIAPVVAWLIIDNVGLQTNLAIAIIVVGISLIPLMRSHRIHKKQQFDNKTARNLLYQWIGLRSFVTFWALSYYKTVSVIIWPLVIFIFVGSYTKLGIINTATTIITIIIIYILGKYMDRNRDKEIVKAALFFESVNRLAASVTVALSLFTNAIIILLDIGHNLSCKSTEATLAKNMYVYAHDNKLNPVYMIVWYEMSHHIIKTVALWWLAVLFYFFPYNQLLLIPITLMLIVIPMQYALFRNQKSL